MLTSCAPSRWPLSSTTPWTPSRLGGSSTTSSRRSSWFCSGGSESLASTSVLHESLTVDLMSSPTENIELFKFKLHHFYRTKCLYTAASEVLCTKVSTTCQRLLHISASFSGFPLDFKNVIPGPFQCRKILLDHLRGGSYGLGNI